MPNNHLLPDELAMRERCERATAGPWEVHADFNIRAPDPRPGRYSGKPTTQCPLTNSALSFEQRKANITLCAHARADIPELLTRLAAERAEVERLRGRVDELENGTLRDDGLHICSECGGAFRTLDHEGLCINCGSG